MNAIDGITVIAHKSILLKGTLKYKSISKKINAAGAKASIKLDLTAVVSVSNIEKRTSEDIFNSSFYTSKSIDYVI